MLGCSDTFLVKSSVIWMNHIYRARAGREVRTGSMPTRPRDRASLTLRDVGMRSRAFGLGSDKAKGEEGHTAKPSKRKANRSRFIRPQQQPPPPHFFILRRPQSAVPNKKSRPLPPRFNLSPTSVLARVARRCRVLTDSVGFLPAGFGFLGALLGSPRSDFARAPRIVVAASSVGSRQSGRRAAVWRGGDGEAMGGQWVEEGMPPSNLQRFLDCTTPTVETHILPKVTQLPPRRVLAFD